MAWARPPGAPQLPSSPLEVLEPIEDDYKPLISEYVLPAILGGSGVLSPILYNFYSKRPLYTGIWKCIVGGVSLTYLGFMLTDLRKEIINDKDAVLKQYVALHPEDFPPYRRQLIKDMLEPWTPRR